MKHSWKYIKNNFYFLGKAFRVSPLYIFAAAILRIIIGVRTSFMSVFFLTYVVSCIEKARPLSQVIIFIVGSFGVVSLSYLLQAFFESVWKPIQLEHITQSLQHAIFDKAQTIDLKQYDSERFYTSIVLANSEGGARVVSVVENLLDLLQTLTTIGVIIGYTFALDTIVPVVAILSFALNLYFNRHIARRRVEYDTAIKKQEKESQMLIRILSLPAYAKDLRLTGLYDVIMARFRSNCHAKDGIIQTKGRKLSRLQAIQPVAASAVWMDFILPLYLAYNILIKHSLFPSQFIGILNGCNQFRFKLEQLADGIGLFFQNGELIERYHSFEEIPSSIEMSANLDGCPVKGGFQSLEMHNVSFAYSTYSFALRNINLSIHNGDKIAVVGQNGSGKSTLIKLILRLYDCDQGEIVYNGTPIQAINLREYRQKFSTLFQDFNIYAASLQENIAMDTRVEVPGIISALSQVELGKYTSELESPLTRELMENGREFSGGELQRMALARAIYEDHDILILDEPTSAMDVEFEKQFYDMISHEFEGKTVLFITHRLTSIHLCDQILYMENGEIVEQGTHEDLIRRNGKYAKLYFAQFQEAVQ